MTKKSKKIGFLTAMAVSVGTVIGSGIFFKNRTVLEHNGGDLALSILSWIIAIIGILAIAICLIEMSSKINDNKGILAWVKKFTKTFLLRSATNYWLLFYLPITIVSISVYTINAIQDLIPGWKPDGWLVTLMAFGIFLWLAITSYISVRASGSLQWIFTIFGNIIPLTIIPIIAIVLGAKGDIVDESGNVITALSGIKSAPGFSSVTPFLGLTMAIPSIMFSFDGFYTITCLKSDMKEPKKVSTIMMFSLILVSILYLMTTIGLIVGSTNGTINGVNIYPAWFKKTLQALISIAVLSTLNGYTISATPNYLASYQEKELPLFTYVIDKIKKVFKIKKDLNAIFIFFIGLIAIAFVLIASLGLGLWRENNKSREEQYGEVANLYQTINLASSFVSIIAYLFIGISVLGAFINRFKKFTDVKHNKWFMPAAVIAIIFTFGAFLFFLIGSISNIWLTDGDDFKASLVSIIILIITIVVSLLLAIPKNKSM
ncbi:amino acid permease [Candidatus Mycoplasma pogonae]